MPPQTIKIIYGPALQPWSGPRLVGVDGSELRVCGYVKLALKIGTASVSTPVVVVDNLMAEGMDFLRHHQCNINIPDSSLTLSQLGITVPLQTPTTKAYSVSLIDTIHIPPRCEVEAMATSEAIANQHRLWLLEGQLSIKSLVVARAVVESTGPRFPVRLLNFSDLPCTCMEEQELAYCSNYMKARCMLVQSHLQKPLQLIQHSLHLFLVKN